MTDIPPLPTERPSNPLEELRASVAARKGLVGKLERAILRLLEALAALLVTLKEQRLAAAAVPEAVCTPGSGSTELCSPHPQSRAANEVVGSGLVTRVAREPRARALRRPRINAGHCAVQTVELTGNSNPRRRRRRYSALFQKVHAVPGARAGPDFKIDDWGCRPLHA